ncbi:MAG: RrF2 family transcriptional regulator [Planctomycetota bacterium]|jgi:Rrf2 family protein
MKLSTRTRYGIRAILEVAESYGRGPLKLKTIAERQEISAKYLEQLIAILKSAGFVRSVRGPRGGYVLAKPAKEIKMSEVFRCLEGSVVTVECLDDESYCKRTTDCATRQLWAEVQKAIMDVLENVALQDLVDKATDSKGLHYNI